jgi:hypothetical protein
MIADGIVATAFAPRSMTLAVPACWFVTKARPRWCDRVGPPTGTVAMNVRLAMSITLTSLLPTLAVRACACRVDGQPEGLADRHRAAARRRGRIDEGHRIAVAVGTEDERPVGRDGNAGRRLADRSPRSSHPRQGRPRSPCYQSATDASARGCTATERIVAYLDAFLDGACLGVDDDSQPSGAVT